MNEEGGWVFGDCEEKVQLNNTKHSEYPDCGQQDMFKIGNGKCDKDFLSFGCRWDELDCVDGLRKTGCNITDVELNQIGDGRCDENFNTLECHFDEGDCECERKGNDWYSSEEIYYKGSCDDQINTRGCHYDSCLRMTGCVISYDEVRLIGNGLCNEKFNKRECRFDGGDCLRVTGCNITDDELLHIRNSECDEKFNTRKCHLDGGDCLPQCEISYDEVLHIGNGLCDKKFNTRECRFDVGDCLVWPDDYSFVNDGVKPTGYDCIQLRENGSGWHNNYLCWRRTNEDPGIRWSSAGRISNMRCTQITEPDDPDTWDDNFLCVPNDSKLHFSWTHNGQTAGKKCLDWDDSAEDPHTWGDNYLCV